MANGEGPDENDGVLTWGNLSSDDRIAAMKRAVRESSERACVGRTSQAAMGAFLRSTSPPQVVGYVSRPSSPMTGTQLLVASLSRPPGQTAFVGLAQRVQPKYSQPVLMVAPPEAVGISGPPLLPGARPQQGTFVGRQMSSSAATFVVPPLRGVVATSLGPQLRAGSIKTGCPFQTAALRDSISSQAPKDYVKASGNHGRRCRSPPPPVPFKHQMLAAAPSLSRCSSAKTYSSTPLFAAPNSSAAQFPGTAMQIEKSLTPRLPRRTSTGSDWYWTPTRTPMYSPPRGGYTMSLPLGAACAEANIGPSPRFMFARVRPPRARSSRSSSSSSNDSNPLGIKRPLPTRGRRPTPSQLRLDLTPAVEAQRQAMEQEALMLEMQKTRELLSQLIAAVGDDKASRSGVELEAETAAHDLHVIHVPHETMEKCPRTAQVASPDALVLGICQGLSTPNCNGQEQMKVGMCEALNTRNADLQTALMNIDMQRPLVEDSWCNDSGDVLAFGQRQVCSAKAKPRPRPLSLTQPDPLVYRMVPLPMPEGFDVSNIEGRSRSSSPAPRSLLRSWLGSGLYFESEAKVG